MSFEDIMITKLVEKLNELLRCKTHSVKEEVQNMVEQIPYTILGKFLTEFRKKTVEDTRCAVESSLEITIERLYSDEESLRCIHCYECKPIAEDDLLTHIGQQIYQLIPTQTLDKKRYAHFIKCLEFGNDIRSNYFLVKNEFDRVFGLQAISNYTFSNFLKDHNCYQSDRHVFGLKLKAKKPNRFVLLNSNLSLI